MCRIPCFLIQDCQPDWKQEQTNYLFAAVIHRGTPEIVIDPVFRNCFRAPNKTSYLSWWQQHRRLSRPERLLPARSGRCEQRLGLSIFERNRMRSMDNFAAPGRCAAWCRRLLIATSAVGTVVLAGCGSLTRVDKETHIREVESFQLMGLDHDEAVRRIEAAGFTCTAYKEREPRIWSYGAKVPVFTRQCSKASFEIFCPQRRYVDFHYTPVEKRVVHVEHPPSLTEQSCF